MHANTTLRSLGAVAALVLVASACTVDKDPIAGPGGNADEPIFTNVRAALSASCGSCHAIGSGRTFTLGLDSAGLVGSGLLDPASPGSSTLLVKTRSASHGGGIVASFSSRDSALIATWIGRLPNVSATTLSAYKTEFAPVIDGVGEAVWLQASPFTMAIGGGWAAATSVTARAMYDEGYLYMYLRWYDAEGSYRRQPWVKNGDGSWSVTAAKPAPINGEDWQDYMARYGGAAFDREAIQFKYEDKLAVMWNTYGAGTVPGFETVGCATACHDPTNGNNPGTTYNAARQDSAAKKYLTVNGQILDMWHWKLVRHNMNAIVDDQYVRYWVPVNDASAGNGGRASDAGDQGYGSNPAINGHPRYKSGVSGYLPAIYSWPSTQNVEISDAEAAGLPVGTQVANLITVPVTGSRADVMGVAVYNPVARVWTMEIRRRLVTADATNDVQFSDLTRAYKFGIAVFDNAQIEHSYSGVPFSLVFRP
jgi:Ethylbenzene dehydrogenase